MAFERNGKAIQSALSDQSKKELANVPAPSNKTSNLKQAKNIRILNDTHEKIKFLAGTIKHEKIYELVSVMVDDYVNNSLSASERETFNRIFKK